MIYFTIYIFLYMESWAKTKKHHMLVWRCHQLLSGFQAKGHLLRVSCLSANDKGDNDMIPGAVHITPGIRLMAEK